MLSKIADRVCTFAAVDFDMVPLARVDRAVESIFERIKAKTMIANPVQYLFRLKEEQCLFTIGVKRLSWETLNLSDWKTHFTDYVSISNTVLDILQVDKFARIGFKVMAFIPLGMTHAEMSRLMFGSFLPKQEDLAPVLGETEDPVVQFHGKCGDLQYHLALTAMNKSNITNVFRQLPNIAHFADDQYLDDNLRTYHDRISADECFHFDVDFSETDVPSRRLSDFLKSSLAEAESLANNCVDFLQAKHKGGVGNA